MFGAIRKLASRFARTPLHPQWFAFLREERNLRDTCKDLSGIVLDVGCAESHPRRFLPADATYIGIDYYDTAVGWYGTRPDLFADARNLPLADESADHALLLDVLEHIPDPELCLAELARALKQGGSLTIQVPFMYPIHDAPLDFHRWTRHGLARAAQRNGFRIDEEKAIGHPLETAALNSNIALSKTILNWIRSRNPLAITILLLPFAVFFNNAGAWLFAKLGRAEDMMPYAYRMTWIKR